ncbi:MAG: metallophosphoesterase [Oscillospiraceae bacterium]|jgi:3',5'-cyclic AMP phosphodiesterase CpdA|nr:metallophosphoesterase [Oscillospiraceae bacterium]
MKRYACKGLALLLAAALLLALLPGGLLTALAAPKPLQIGLMSDTHIFPYELTGNDCSAFREYSQSRGKSFAQSEAVLDSTLTAMETHAKKNGLSYVLISGDLTKDGELEGHQKLAKTLAAFEKRTGIQVAVIPGNHDINNSDAATFASGKRQPGTETRPEQFLEIYQDFGFDLPNLSRFVPKAGNKGGMLSYAADLGEDYRLIAIDTCKYSSDQSPKGEHNDTAGMIGEDLMAWILQEIKEAKAAGKLIIGMGHHNLTPHIGWEDKVFHSFMLDDYERVRETLASAGLHYYVSGHIHVGEIGDYVADNGERLYDICSSALVSYPSTFREVAFSGSARSSSADVKTYEADCVKPVTAMGVTYPSPYSTTAYHLSFGDEGLKNHLSDLLAGVLGDLFATIRDTGGISAFLSAQGLDLESMLDGALDGGVKAGSVTVLPTKNIMSLIGDILGQVDQNYINDPKRLLGLVDHILNRGLGMQVSDLPSTQLYQTLGIGDPNRPGTFEDMAAEVIAYTYSRNSGAAKDRFLLDAIDGFEHGDSADRFFQLLLDIVLNDVVQSELLPSLKLNLSSVFQSAVMRYTVGALLDGILRLVLLGDNSFSALADLIFRLGVLPYDSIDDAVDSLLDDFWTPSQSESIGILIADLIRDFVFDKQDYSDLNATLPYRGPVKVSPTQADFRLPTLLTQTFGPDAATTRTIGWFTKDTVTGTDLELTDAKTGKSALGNVQITKTTEATERSYPGADLGIFGILPWTKYLQRHTIEISGLQPGKTYYFRVGDAACGWWSLQGMIRTADGGKTTTFLSFTDEQSQRETQYQRSWAALAQQAAQKFPAARFLVSAGDQVDNKDNLFQWQWLFDTAQDSLLRLPLMPTTGNHEEGGAALNQYFPLGNAPEQDLDSGVYYSFDYNNLHFIVLNTNDVTADNTLGQAQMQWLKADAAASDADWKIVLLHKSLYSNGSHMADKDVTGLRTQLGALLPQLGVDLVIEGHDHVYLRTDAMADGAVVPGATRDVTYNGLSYKAKVDPQGTVYTTAGASGVKLYQVKDATESDALFPRAESLVPLDGPVFAAYQTVNGVLYYDAYTLENGKLRRIDSFAIEKTGVEDFVPPPGWGEDDLPAFPDTADTIELIFWISPALLLAAGAALLLWRRKNQAESERGALHVNL